ncbi:sigma-70 family RNA polymerase sigma factor [Arthrobacter sp. CAN_A1]|uniref:sigma-70 family RNA polymerase sigma factor n=1 Tax=Arthrobacter sp. CAN_A1 TaxID=2787717 RepID=UPI001A2BBA2F
MSTDKDIILRSRGYPAVFSDLYTRHATAIYRYAQRRAGDSVADDVLSETFLVAFKQRDSFNTAWDDARPWLFGIATNLLKKHHRTEARVTKAYIRSVERPDSQKPMEDVDAAIDAQVSSRLIVAALAAMPAKDRDTILLFAWAELSYEGIATAMDVPIGTVRSRLHRARTSLRSTLGSSPHFVEEGSHERATAAQRNA